MRTRVCSVMVAAALLRSQALAMETSPEQDYLHVAYCDLVRNPAGYDGKKVSVQATYRYGFEWQEIYCVECRASAKTWLEFPGDPPTQIKKALKGVPQYQGTLNATFRGVFHSCGSFGDGGDGV